MQMWLNLGIKIKITMLGTILMHALWRKVVLFIIKIMKKSIIPNPQIEKGDTQDCVIEDVVFHDNLSKNSDRTNDKQNMSSKLVQLNQLLI